MKLKEAGTCPEAHVSQEYFEHKVCPTCEAAWAQADAQEQLAREHEAYL